MKRFLAAIPVVVVTVGIVAGLGRLVGTPRPDADEQAQDPTSVVAAPRTRTVPALVPGAGPQASEPRLERVPLAEARRRARLLARDPAALPGFLDGLERRAREQGAVTNHEIDPGIEAIQASLATLGPDAIRREVESFRSRMIDLSQNLAEHRSSDAL